MKDRNREKTIEREVENDAIERGREKKKNTEYLSDNAKNKLVH